MKENKSSIENIIAANQKINRNEGDARVYGSTEGLSEAEQANVELQKAFYSDDRQEEVRTSTTYITNNTAPIQVNKRE